VLLDGLVVDLFNHFTTQIGAMNMEFNHHNFSKV